MASIEGGVH